MGNAISSIFNSVDNQEEKKKEANDALNALMVMAEDKARLHYESVVNNALDAKLVPVHKVITKIKSINCGVSKNADGLKKNLGDTIGKFVHGQILDGLVGLASQTLDVLMGNVAANKSEYTSYSITVGQLGGIGRIDFYMFYYKYTSKSLSEVTEDCLITSLVLSSVDPRDLKENDVDVILENNYSARAPGETDEVVNARLVKIKELVMKEIKDSS